MHATVSQRNNLSPLIRPERKHRVTPRELVCFEIVSAMFKSITSRSQERGSSLRINLRPLERRSRAQ
jgi:hypothetical protein